MVSGEKLAYHEDRINVWQTSVEQYADQVENLEYFLESEDSLQEEEIPVLSDQIDQYTHDILPDTQQQARESFEQLLQTRKKLSNSLNHDFSYDELPDDTEVQEALYEEADALAQRYLSVEEKQETALDHATQVVGPLYRIDPDEPQSTESVRETAHNAVPDAVRETATSYTEKVKNALSDPNVQSLLAVGSVFGAAAIGEYLSEDDEPQKKDKRSRLY